MTIDRIMIVEDERIVALNIEQRLRAEGYDVVSNVATGENAIVEAGATHPDLALMDIRLAGAMDGITAAACLRKEFEIPVIFLTANADQTTTEHAGQTDAFGFLLKPVDTRELHAAIQIALTRHRSEARVRSSEERLRLAMDAAQLGSWDLNTATRRLRLSGRTLHQMLGVTTEPIDEDWNQLLQRVHPDDRLQVADALERQQADTPIMRLEFRSLLPGNEVRWLVMHGKLYQVHHAETDHFIGVLQDVTATHLAQEHLRQAATVFKGTGEGIIITNADRRIIAVNPAFTRITGYEADEAIGQDPGIIKSGRHGKAFYEELWRSLEQQGQWEGEVHDRRKNGETFFAWENISVIRDTDGGVSHYVAIFADISATKEAEEQLLNLAYYDPLTGLPNRTLFCNRLEHVLEHGKRDHYKVAVMFLDLDRFKNINDTLGHASGDQLLRAVAKRLKECLRSSDTLARLGGDEFTAILEDIHEPHDAAGVARKMVESMREPIQVKGHEVMTSASIGISLFPDDADNANELVRAADTAMYGAKEKGRNGYQFYAQSMTERTAQHLRISNGLCRALENGEFSIEYQPQIAAGGHLLGLEALLRWNEPELGRVSPAQFIPVAEENGTIGPIGAWVIHRACTDLIQLRDEGYPVPRVAVNLSVWQILRDHLVDIVTDTLNSTGLEPAALELEVTESALQTVTDSLDSLDELKALGVSLSVDDFGTGFSCLNSLKRLPIDTIKIDQSFVADIPGDGNDAAIIEAVIAIARAMGLQVIAEGVETEAQRAYLENLGCTNVQGHLFCKPLPLTELRLWLSTHRYTGVH